MTVRHLRAILKKYGGFGVLFVAGYLLLHEGWTRRRGWLLLGVSIAVGLPCGLALLPHRTLPRSPRIASPHLHIVLAPTPQTPRSTWEPVSVQARQRLDEAEKMLHRYVDTPPRADNGNAPDSYEIEGTIQASLDEEASGMGIRRSGGTTHACRQS
jgi:hypothetical protein